MVAASQLIVAVIALPLFFMLTMMVGFSVPYFGVIIIIINALFGTKIVFAVWMHWVCVVSFVIAVFYAAFKMKG